MGAGHLGGPESASLRGRRSECAACDALVAAVRQGESRVLVVRGEAGIGKSALLAYLVGAASDLTVVRAIGVESEMELAFASLHQFCAPMLDRLERLPAPQREALEIVFGLTQGPAPDRFLVGLAVLSLLSETAGERPLLCVVDDAQWLDRASALTLAFAARRLLAERVGLVFGARVVGEALRGLPELEVRGLGVEDARALLKSAVRFPLGEQVRDRIVAETGGNPLALLELPRGLTAAQLAGGFGLLGAQALSGRIEESFARRLEALPEETQRLLLLAAAEPAGDPLLVWRAAERLGISAAATIDTETDGLLTLGEQVTFRHPLVRSAVYRSAAAEERRAVHLALADVTDRQIDPDRRAWHLAAAATGPDEEIASELEHSAGRAQARGGLAAAAAFLQRSVALTGDPARRVDRALAAARANLYAGTFDTALRMLLIAEAGSPDELQRARTELLRAQIAFSLEYRKRRAATTGERRQTAGEARSGAGARDLPGCLGSGDVRRASGRGGRSARGLPCRQSGSCAGAYSSSVGSAPGRARAADHRRAHRSGVSTEARLGGLRRDRRSGREPVSMDLVAACSVLRVVG